MRIKILIIAFCLLLAGSPAFAAAGTSGAAFLKIGIGAREMAMGGAGGTLTGSAESAYWNPAALAGIKNISIALAGNKWIADITHEYISAAFRLGGVGVIGINAVLLQIPGIELRDASENPLGTKTGQNAAYSFSYAGKLSPALAVGVNIKMISQGLESYDKDYKATGFGADAGFIYTSADEKMALGAALQNAGTAGSFSTKADALPMNLKVSGSYKLLNDRLLVAGTVNYLLADSMLTYGAGAEYCLSNMFYLRAGYGRQNDIDKGLNAGFGIKFGSFGADFSYTPLVTAFGESMKVSLSANF